MTGARLSARALAAYALPAIPTAALALPLTVYVAPFWASQMGLGTAMVGAVFLAVRLADIGFDPLFGRLSDATRTRWGRRRPWLVGVVPPLILALIALFDPPAESGPAWLAAGLGAVYLGFSVLTISHTAWGAELSSDYHERSRIAAARQIAFIGGMLLVLALPAALEFGFRAGPRVKVEAMGGFIIASLIACIGLSVATTPESRRPPPPPEAWRDLFGRLAAGGAMRAVLTADLAVGTATSITAALYLFLVEQTLHLARSSALLLLYFVAGLAGAPAWAALSRRLGKHRALTLACLFAAGVLPAFFLVPRDGRGGAAAIALTLAFGLTFGAGPVLLHAMMADVADQETARSGAQRQGSAFALLTLTNKLGYALSVGLTYPLLQWLGFSGREGARNGEAALSAILWIFVAAPLVLFLLAAAVLWRFPLGEAQQRALRAQIGAAG